MKEIILLSDFHDYYDYQFSSVYFPKEVIHLERNMRNPKISRKQMLEWGNKNFNEVHYSYKKSDFQEPWMDGVSKDWQVMVVEHLDEYAHAGDGKRLVSLNEAGEDTLKVDFMGFDANSGAKSLRHLYIGRHLFVLEYRCETGWQSNGPGCTISLQGVYPDTRERDASGWRDGEFLKEYPLLAFDFITHPDYCHDDSNYFHLLDINTSPSWKGTFLEEMLHPVVVYEWIKEYMNELQNQ